MTIYLDYMATTPLDPRVSHAMSNCLEADGSFANPTSSHKPGREAAQLLVNAEQQVAAAIGARAEEIVWTSGATEANNLALFGAAEYYQSKGKHIISMSTEHKAVLDVLHHLEQQGFDITLLAPEADGLLDLTTLKNAIRPDTILVSIMQVNNEIGVVQDIAAIGALCREHKVLLHVDAAQSIGKVDVNVDAMHVDLLSLASHKAYGPKGIGALYVRQFPRVRLQPLLFGGGQQRGIRPGTLPLHQCVAMGEAVAIAEQEREQDCARILVLREQLWQGISELGDVVLNGSEQQRVAHNLSVSFGGVNGASLFLALEALAVSNGSACSSVSIAPSHVLSAIGLDKYLARATIRFSLGRFTTAADITEAIKIIQTQVRRLRAMAPKAGVSHV